MFIKTKYKLQFNSRYKRNIRAETNKHTFEKVSRNMRKTKAKLNVFSSQVVSYYVMYMAFDKVTN